MGVLWEGIVWLGETSEAEGETLKNKVKLREGSPFLIVLIFSLLRRSHYL